MDLIEVTLLEIDIKKCSETYGEGNCTAELGVTGDQKCFNTRNFTCDCQDPDNFNETTQTVRFGIDNGFLPESIPCIPNLKSVKVDNARVEPGISIGLRATATATFKNHPHGDAGFDPYIADRSYNPFDQGTFWGKFKARNSYLEAQPFRVRRGYVGQALADFTTEHFVIDTFMGPDADGKVQIKAVDFMRLLSAKNAQAPEASLGFINANITDSETAVTLEPVGIGAEYPASGTWSIGDELMTFTKTSGDDFTITRAEGNTVAAEHESGDVAQVALVYTSETSADIIYDLVVNYSPLDASYTELTLWQSKVAEFSDTLYSATIVKPTAVETLINELIQQAGLVVFGDNINQKVYFDVVRRPSDTGITQNKSRIIDGSFQQTDQPNRRYSQVWVFYNQRDIYKNLDEPTNFYSAFVKTPGVNLYATDSIKKIYSRWIGPGARSVANDVSSRAIARHLNPPRRFTFSLFASNPNPPSLGQAIPLRMPTLEDCFGAESTVSAIITGVRRMGEGFIYEAEELNFDAGLADIGRTFDIDYDAYNINLRDIYDSQYSEIQASTPIKFIIRSGFVVGSTSTLTYALETGDWPSGIEPELVIESGAYVVGRGGNGGYGNSGVGDDGGSAMNVTSAIAINNQGVIGGGGGGGGGGVLQIAPFTAYLGGGGAGRNGGSGNPDGVLTTGGNSNTVGDGGDLGQSGTMGSGGPITHYAGGSPGNAVNGDSLVDWTNTGTILGAQIG